MRGERGFIRLSQDHFFVIHVVVLRGDNLKVYIVYLDNLNIMYVAQHFSEVRARLGFETRSPTHETLAKAVVVSVHRRDTHEYVVVCVWLKDKTHDAARQTALEQNGVCLMCVVYERVDVRNNVI